MAFVNQTELGPDADSRQRPLELEEGHGTPVAAPSGPEPVAWQGDRVCEHRAPLGVAVPTNEGWLLFKNDAHGSLPAPTPGPDQASDHTGLGSSKGAVVRKRQRQSTQQNAPKGVRHRQPGFRSCRCQGPGATPHASHP